MQCRSVSAKVARNIFDTLLDSIGELGLTKDEGCAGWATNDDLSSVWICGSFLRMLSLVLAETLQTEGVTTGKTTFDVR